MTPSPIVLWREDDWWCELHPGVAGEGRLVVYRGSALATAEATATGQVAELRAEVLRQRVLRGDLRADT